MSWFKKLYSSQEAKVKNEKPKGETKNKEKEHEKEE